MKELETIFSSLGESSKLILYTCAIGFMVSGCLKKSDRNNTTNDIMKHGSDPFAVKCFDELLAFDENFYGNSFIRKMDSGNYLRQKAINDSQFVLYCGRKWIEYKVDTFSCATTSSYDMVFFEDESFIYLISRGGMWLNNLRVYPVYEHGNVIDADFSFVDTINHRGIEVLDKNDDSYFFSVIALREGTAYNVQIPDVDSKVELSDITVVGTAVDTIFYTIKDSDVRFVKL